MRVEFEFDAQKVNELGYSIEQITATLKNAFCKDGFQFYSNEKMLVFSGNGSEDDFSNMWFQITRVVNSKWFMQCAKACRWYDLSDNGKEEIFEDVLAQAAFLIRKRA